MWEERNQDLQTERGREKNIHPVEERRSREDISDMSCLAKAFPRPLFLLPSPGTLSAHRSALPLWLRCLREVCLS